MDFTNHKLTTTRLSSIERFKKLKQSSIDNRVNELRDKLHDDTLDPGFVAQTMVYLSESDVNNVLIYVLRKANRNPGRAFVKICNNKMIEKGSKPAKHN